jgi:GxxExxY protein
MNTENATELNDITSAIIGAAQTVSKTLGCGFLEKVYENALALELRVRGHEVRQHQAVEVRYREEIVGDYVADLIVDRKVIVELKATPCLEAVHKAQCLNYLRATGMRLALLVNFGRPKLEVRRVISGYSS